MYQVVTIVCISIFGRSFRPSGFSRLGETPYKGKNIFIKAQRDPVKAGFKPVFSQISNGSEKKLAKFDKSPNQNLSSDLKRSKISFKSPNQATLYQQKIDRK